MEEKKTKIRCVACSIFKDIVDKSILLNSEDLQIEFVTSMLHMHPEKLYESLSWKIKNTGSVGEDILLLYGDCHPFMFEMENQEGVRRVKGINCIEILLEEKQYKKLRSEGAFFLMPEWTLKWEEVFQKELGLNEFWGKDFFNEFHTKLIYLDTGQIEAPIETLKEVSRFTGLPYEIVKTDNQIITIKLNEIIRAIKSGTD